MCYLAAYIFLRYICVVLRNHWHHSYDGTELLSDVHKYLLRLELIGIKKPRQTQWKSHIYIVRLLKRGFIATARSAMTASEPMTETVQGRLNEQNGKPHKPPVSFEDALDLAGHGKFHLLLTLGCGFCLVTMVAEVFGTAFLIPAAQCEFEMGSTEKGLLNAFGFMGMILSSHLWGYLADTRGRRKTLLASLLLDAVCGFASSLADTYWLFSVLRFFNGFFVCASSSVVFVYLGEFHSASTRSSAVMYMSVFLSVGGIFQQGVSWLIIPQDWALELPWITFSSWRVFVVISSLTSIVAIAILLLLPESPKFLFSQGKEVQALDVLRHVYAVNAGRDAEEYPVERVLMDINDTGPVAVAQPTSALEIAKSMWLQTKPLFQRPNLLLTTLACITQFLLCGSFSGFALWLPDMYNRLAIYLERHPDHTVTFCDVVVALANSTALTDSFMLATGIDNQTSAEISNVTSSVLAVLNFNDTVAVNAVANNTEDTIIQNVTDTIKTNATLNATLGVTEGLWVLNNTAATPTCSSTVNPAAFRNSLAIGLVCIVVYAFAGYLVKFVKRKPLLMTFSFVSSVMGATLLAANTEVLVVALASLYIATNGVCINMLSTVVIDLIPTQFRAMAVCLSLMSGRLGVTVFSLVIGFLLDYACNAIFILLCVVVLGCCLLMYLLPGPPKSTD